MVSTHTLRRIGKLLIAAIIMGHASVIAAQVMIANVNMDPNAISESTLFTMDLTNTGAVTELTVRGELREKDGPVAVQFVTAPFNCGVGHSRITSSMLRMRSFQYGNSNAAASARTMHRLPAGAYTFCVELLEGNETADKTCEPVEAEDFIALDLVHPWNGDTIEEVRPALTWMVTGALTGAEVKDTRLVLVPLPDKQRAQQALASERPFFAVDEPARVLAYPAGMPDLQRGKCYAWQVERTQQGRVLDRSEGWSFCVRKNETPVAMKYVRLEDLKPSFVYQVVDEWVYFRYEEAYKGEALTCWVERPDGRKYVTGPSKEMSETRAEVGSKSVGLNLFEIDLGPLQLGSGMYLFKVRNEKQRVFELQINIP